MNFLEACYSYLFGDGDPNEGLDTLLDQTIARLIQQNNGYVTAEEVAPYMRTLPVEVDGSQPVQVDESFMLPLLIKYGGQPIVTEEGNIIYRFEELSKGVQYELAEGYRKLEVRSAIFKRESGESDALLLDEVGVKDIDYDALLELQGQFSRAEKNTQAIVGLFGLVNLGGAVWLGQTLATLGIRGGSSAALSASTVALRDSPFLLLLGRAYPLLAGYAVLFNLIPLGRFVSRRLNTPKMDGRNSRRVKFFSRIRRIVKMSKERGREMREGEGGLSDQDRTFLLKLRQKESMIANNLADSTLEDQAVIYSSAQSNAARDEEKWRKLEEEA